MLLSDKRIMEELAHGNIIIEPFDQRQLGTNSYDCRLGEWYFQGDANIEVMHLDNADEIRLYWGEPRKARNGKIAIRPGTTILAHTQESSAASTATWPKCIRAVPWPAAPSRSVAAPAAAPSVISPAG